MLICFVMEQRGPAKGKVVTLKTAQKCVELTLDGKQRLDLSLKEIAAVPKCVQKLCHVDELDLSRNLITKVPSFIDQFTSLCVLDLHSNYIEELPVIIGRLQKLQVLNLCNNRLTSLPHEVGLLAKLHTLSLGLNRLEALPSSVGALKELRSLGLSDNRFTRVPSCLSRLSKLERVNLDRNPIDAKQTSGAETVTISQDFHLVKESFLCLDCLNKCKTDRQLGEIQQNIKTSLILLQSVLTWISSSSFQC
uniref:Leucine rich repeat containing 18b n=1 Tax=Salarias fasciatus TaxID=181472 RepID=A0A672HWV7_SALFA